MNLYLIFDNFGTEHINKDLIQIPRSLQRNESIDKYFVLCRDKIKEVECINPPTLIRTFNFTRTLFYLYWILKYAKSKDIINVYHLCFRSAFFILILKYIKKDLITYLRADINNSTHSLAIAENIGKTYIDIFCHPRSNVVKLVFAKLTLKFTDIISVENKSIYRFAKKWSTSNLILLPYGVSPDVNFINQNKCKQIIHVARLGDPNKRSELVVKAFNRSIREGLATIRQDWNLLLVGKSSKAFELWVSEYTKNQGIDNLVHLTGSLDHTNLMKEMSKSSICFNASQTESGPLVAIESLASGCILISTDVGIVPDLNISTYLIYNNELDIEEQGSLVLRKLFAETIDYQKMRHSALFYQKNYSWDELTIPLRETLKKICS